MTVTFGFYDSLNGDRKYNARQMSQLFKGIITDGVFQSIGTGLVVTVNTGMSVNVGIGRAWFNNTWTDNDAVLPLTIEASESVLNRIDTVALEVNSDTSSRTNSIKVIKGTPASTPVPPTLANTATLHQYALAWIWVGFGVTSITSNVITNRVGSSETPFASGAVPTYDFGAVLNSWEEQFSDWFNNLVDQLTGVQVTNLQNQIDILNAQVGKLSNYKIVPSVSSNHLTVSIKTSAGTDPSSSDPARFKIGDTTYDLTAATSFTKNAGTNWCNLGSTALATLQHEVFMYAIAETGASAGLKFGFSRIPYAKQMSDFVNTNTNEKYIAGNWVNFNNTDLVTNIGRFGVVLGATASFNWSYPGTSLVINRPIFETNLLTWTPTWTAGGGGTFTSVTDTLRHYQISDRWIRTQIHSVGTITGTVTSVVCTLPFNSFRIASTLPTGNAKVNGGRLGNAELGSGTPNVLGHSQYDAAAFNVGAMAVKSVGIYEI